MCRNYLLCTYLNYIVPTCVDCSQIQKDPSTTFENLHLHLYIVQLNALGFVNESFSMMTDSCYCAFTPDVNETNKSNYLNILI